jgi:DNA (cytosine-5)-methyltransferase 1
MFLFCPKGYLMIQAGEPALKAISLFSGAGGMDVGVKEAGFQILLANDLDPDACATYRKNHGAHIVEGTVHDLFPLTNHLAAIDLVFGGPPCQGFSVAGKMDPEDPRSQLMMSFFDVVERVKPKAFICENVKAFAELTKWSELRQSIILRAEKTHLVKMIVLTASNFGVPQNRERMFLIGVDRARFPGDQKEFDALVEEVLEGRKASPPTVGEVVRKLGRAGTAQNSRTCSAKITHASNPVMRRSPYAGMLFNGAGRPLSANGVASTLPASMGGNKTPIVDEAEIFESKPAYVETYHQALVAGHSARKGDAPSQLRRLTVDECLAIQTFPEDYILAGPKSAMYRQIGNAVPCRLAEAVAYVASKAIGSIYAAEWGELADPELIAAE